MKQREVDTRTRFWRTRKMFLRVLPFAINIKRFFFLIFLISEMVKFHRLANEARAMLRHHKLFLFTS